MEGLSFASCACFDGRATGGLNHFQFTTGAEGIAKGFADDLEHGYFVDLAAQIRAEVEGDFLGQAHRLLEEV
jgi:hypothetical protein